MENSEMTEGAKQTAGVATASLILGILGLVCIGPVAAIPAVICGHMARKKIRNSQGALQGDGMALAGLIMGYVGIVVAIVGILIATMAIAIPSFVNAREEAMQVESQASMCTVTLRTLESAAKMYQADMNTYPDSLQDLIERPKGEDDSDWNGPYIDSKQKLVDPWGNEFMYVYPGMQNPDGFDLKSFGPDQIESQDDVICETY